MNYDKEVGDFKICTTTVLGQGGTSKVVLGYNKNNEQIAVKIFDKAQFNGYDKQMRINQLKQEISIMQQLKHKNIIKLYNYAETQNSIYIFMEKADCTLNQYLSKNQLNEQKLKLLFRDLFNTFLDLVNAEITNSKLNINIQGIVHSDINPNNLLMIKDQIKICDFGIAQSQYGNSFPILGLGTPLFMSPQQLMAEEIPHDQLEKHDIWSMGVILYKLVYSEHPYIRELQLRYSTFLIAEQIKNNTIEYPQCQFSKELVDLIQKMLVIDFRKRISWQQSLQHPWLAQ